MQNIRRVKTYIYRHPDHTLRNDIEDLNLPVCRQTLSKELKRQGYIYVNKPLKPRISPTHMAARVNFARNHRRTNWREYLFGDEVSIEFSKNIERRYGRKGVKN